MVNLELHQIKPVGHFNDFKFTNSSPIIDDLIYTSGVYLTDSRPFDTLEAAQTNCLNFHDQTGYPAKILSDVENKRAYWLLSLHSKSTLKLMFLTFGKSM